VSLPSVEFLKDQATRLVTYLGDKHRFRLKPASALEAVAAMWQQHDWNTLHGLAPRDATRPSGAVEPLASPAAYPVSWNERDEPDLTVSANDWFRHTLAAGGAASSRRNWLGQQMLENIERGVPGVFVNLFGSERAGVRDLNGEVEQSGAAGSHARAMLVNLLSDMEPEELAAMLVALAFRPGAGDADGYWMQSAQRVLAAAARALREAGDTVTLAQLAELFPLHAPPVRLEALSARLAPGSSTKEHLSSMLRSHSGPDGVFSANTWSAHYSVLAQSLSKLRSESWTVDLFSSSGSAPGLHTLLAQGKCLGIEWQDGSGERAGVAVLHALRSAMRKRLLAPREEKQTAWTIALGEVAGYLDSSLVSMVEQGRSARVAVLMTARDSRELGLQPAGRSVLSNVWNHVHLRVSPEQLAELLARVGDGPVLVQPGRLTAPLLPR
jgi:hypothetical protein